MNADALVGMKEIAEAAGVSRNTVKKWRVRHAATFPPPLASLAAGPVWQWGAIEAWLEARDA